MRKRNFFDDFEETHKPEPSPITAAPAQDPTPEAEVVPAPEPEVVAAPQVETSSTAAESEVEGNGSETE